MINAHREINHALSKAKMLDEHGHEDDNQHVAQFLYAKKQEIKDLATKWELPKCGKATS